VDSVAIFAFDVSVATCARLLRPLSRTQLIADCQGHFCKPRRDAVPAFVTRDAFRRSRFERLPPHGVSLSCDGLVSNLGGLEGYAFSIRPTVSLRLCRLVLAHLSVLALEVFPRG